METPSPYAAEALHQVPRLIGLLDREPCSPTYGCGDRAWWQWKFTDFPNARGQEAASVLGILFTHPFEGNIYYKQEKIREWAYACMEFWMKTPDRGGSYKEAYPHEHSFVATAFSLLAVCECLLRLDEKAAPRFQRLLNGVNVAAKWLTRNIETHAVISNHLSGGAAALQDAWLLTGNEAYRTRARELLDVVARNQSEEGWFSEYGGADPGYQTQGTYYLAKYHERGGDDAALNMLRRANEFQQYFVHPDGTIGGEYGSRNTEFYFPAGYEILAPRDPVAAAIADALLPSVASRRLAGLHAMDAFNFIPLLNNWLEAALHRAEGREKAELPAEGAGEIARNFPKSGLLIRKTPSYYAVLGMGKGGVIKVYDLASRELAHSDCGYAGRLEGGRLCTSQWKNPECAVSVEENRIEVTTPFFKIERAPFSPLLFVAFRVFVLLLGKFVPAMFMLKKLIVRRLIHGAERLRPTLKREIRFGESDVTITDMIEMNGGGGLESLASYDKFCAVHMGSSKYFQETELNTPSVVNEIQIDSLNRDGRVRVEKTVRCKLRRSE